jgi:16S rRNA (uracil1498-N3)-methyltransferase
MRHVPHLLVEPPWPEGVLGLDAGRLHHLRRVLRLAEGAPVVYTDGSGTVGEGVFAGEGVERGAERAVDRPPIRVTVAVALPDSRDRQRFLVEKLAELGVERIRWLDTRYGEGRPPAAGRARKWADAGLEQSRGAWRTMVDDAPVPLAGLEGMVWAAVPGAPPMPAPPSRLTLAIGPEGGWAPDDLPAGVLPVGLGERVLRVETAAVVGAGLVLVR